MAALIDCRTEINKIISMVVSLSPTGIGFNVVYQLTDCPILLSDHKDICMFDPHLRYVPGACDERPGGHVDLKQDANFAKLFPDFMAGFLSEFLENLSQIMFACSLFVHTPRMI